MHIIRENMNFVLPKILGQNHLDFGQEIDQKYFTLEIFCVLGLYKGRFPKISAQNFRILGKRGPYKGQPNNTY